MKLLISSNYKSVLSQFCTKLTLVAVLTTSSLMVYAEDHAHHQHKKHEVLKVDNVFATPTFALAKMGAGYFTLSNTSDNDVVITGVSVAKKVANKAELHETYFDGELAKMRQLEMPFTIKAGESVEFVPQGKHLMVMGLNKPLEKGNSFALTITFESGAEQVIVIPVQEKPGVDADHHHH